MALVSTAALAAFQLRSLTANALANGLQGVAMASVDLAGGYHSVGQTQVAVRSILHALTLQPGFQSVGFGTALPGRAPTAATVFLANDAASAEDLIDIGLIATGGDAVDALGLRLRHGRDLRATDTAGAPHVAIISARVAQALFGSERVLGRSLTLRAWEYERPGRPAADAPADDPVVVVGVCSDPPAGGRGRGLVLVPYAQRFLPGGVFAVRASGDVRGAAISMAAVIHRTQPDAGLIESGPAQDLALPATLAIRTTATLAGYLGALTLFLTSLGFYGVLSQLVSARTREIALRVSLGASRMAVRLLVAREASVPMILGGALGFVIARLVSGRLLFIYIRPQDHLESRLALATMAVLATIAVAACWIPMRRALRIDVARALHEP